LTPLWEYFKKLRENSKGKAHWNNKQGNNCTNDLKKKALIADFSQLQLGQDIKGKTLYITVKLEMILLMGEKRQFQALYNSGAEINFIKYDLAKKHELTLLQKWWKPITGFLDEHWIKLHSTYKFTMSVADMHNCTKVIGLQLFWAANFAGYNFILRYLWLAEADPKIYFKTGTFK